MQQLPTVKCFRFGRLEESLTSPQTSRLETKQTFMLFPVCLLSCAACNATHKTQVRGKETAVRQRKVDFPFFFSIIQPRFKMYHAALLVQGKFQNLADLNARVRRVF